MASTIKKEYLNDTKKGQKIKRKLNLDEYIKR